MRAGFYNKGISIVSFEQERMMSMVKEQDDVVRDVPRCSACISEEELLVVKTFRGLNDAEAGRFRDASDVFDDLLARYAK